MQRCNLQGLVRALGLELAGKRATSEDAECRRGSTGSSERVPFMISPLHHHGLLVCLSLDAEGDTALKIPLALSEAAICLKTLTAE